MAKQTAETVVTCGGCGGRGWATVLVNASAKLYACGTCGGVIGRAKSRKAVAEIVDLDGPMLANADSTRYFDIDFPIARARVHGWYDTASRRVVQFG